MDKWKHEGLLLQLMKEKIKSGPSLLTLQELSRRAGSVPPSYGETAPHQSPDLWECACAPAAAWLRCVMQHSWDKRSTDGSVNDLWDVTIGGLLSWSWSLLKLQQLEVKSPFWLSWMQHSSPDWVCGETPDWWKPKFTATTSTNNQV